MRNRKGFHLTEALVAMLLVGGPLLSIVHLVEGNVRGASFNQQRASTQMVLAELAEILMGESPAELSRACASPAALSDLLARRIEHLPEAARAPYQRQVGPLLHGLSGHLE